MELKSLFSSVLGKVKGFLEDRHFTFDQFFYFGLVIVAKLFGVLDLPWLVVGLAPLIPPTYFKKALSWAGGLAKKLFEKLKPSK